MSDIMPEDLLIGAHTSAAGGAHNALIEGKTIGATTIQFFTANQKQWKGKPLTEEGIAVFKETLEQTGLQKIMSHDSYLINLGSPDPVLREKSLVSFGEEIERCLAYGLSFLNFHPGAATTDTKESCLDRIVQSLLLFEDRFTDESTRLLLENTAGQGSSVGTTFEEIAYILDRTKGRLPMGVCLDTCHLFVAGYDVRSDEAWQKTLKAFDQIVGLESLYAFHLNDSATPFGSHKDRHANLGEGEIGLECFKFLMTHPKTQQIPKYLETPGGPPTWDKEIWMLREFARSAQ